MLSDDVANSAVLRKRTGVYAWIMVMSYEAKCKNLVAHMELIFILTNDDLNELDVTIYAPCGTSLFKNVNTVCEKHWTFTYYSGHIII